MKPKATVKIVIDVLMTAVLLFVMGYQFWGQAAHEWVGAGLLALMAAHNILNGSWYRSLFKGRYSPMRIFQLCVDLLTLASVLAMLYSGVVMSRRVFDFLPAGSDMTLARRMHILGAYWGFTFLSVHLGLHWGMFMAMAKRRAKIKAPSKGRATAFFATGLMIAAYGLYVFLKRDFPTYMLLRSEFVFLDYNESKVLFYLDYLSLMGLWIFVSHYFSKFLKERGIMIQKNGNK